MKTKQNKIPKTDNYSIVSVFQPNKIWGANDIMHRSVVDILIRKGFRVQELNGCWYGFPERSIRIEGVGHKKAAWEFANEFEQQTYIHVHNGVAEVLNPAGGTIDTFTHIEECDASAACFTEVQGFFFRFI
jgi:hypothetical protein